MADIIAGIAPRVDTHANWTSLNPTLGKDNSGKSYGQIIISTGSPVGDLILWGNAETYLVAYAAGQYTVLGNPETTPSGQVAPFAMASAPSGWLACDGSAVSRTTYSNLFTAIGTTWGAGDGSTTFNLPDLRGAFLRGAGAHGTETDAGGTAFTGPAVGAYQDDQMQLITGEWSNGGNADTTGAILDAGGTTTGAFINGSAKARSFTTAATPSRNVAFNSSYSPNARTSATTGGETRPFGAGVYYCIKI